MYIWYVSVRVFDMYLVFKNLILIPINGYDIFWDVEDPNIDLVANNPVRVPL